LKIFTAQLFINALLLHWVHRTLHSSWYYVRSWHSFRFILLKITTVYTNQHDHRKKIFWMWLSSIIYIYILVFNCFIKGFDFIRLIFNHFSLHLAQAMFIIRPRFKQFLFLSVFFFIQLYKSDEIEGFLFSLVLRLLSCSFLYEFICFLYCNNRWYFFKFWAVILFRGAEYFRSQFCSWNWFCTIVENRYRSRTTSYYY
jgi:hypothetical protein